MSNLEKMINRVCKEQPSLGAPATLSARVLAEIERRAARPWWRQSFTHWPLPVRAAFVVACTGAIWSTFSAPLARLFSTVYAPVTWAHQAGATVSLVNSVFGHVSGDLAHSVSPLVLYGTGFGICGLYVFFAGLCAATYRTLYVSIDRTAGIKL